MKKIDSLSIIINFDGYSQRAKKKTSKIESDVETVIRYAKNRGRYEKNAKKYAKNLGLRAMLYCGRPLKSQATEQSMRRFFGGPLLGRPSAGRCSGGRPKAGQGAVHRRESVGCEKISSTVSGWFPRPPKGGTQCQNFPIFENFVLKSIWGVCTVRF